MVDSFMEHLLFDHRLQRQPALDPNHLAGLLLLLGGLVSIGVGIALYITLPWSGLWVLGTLIAIELIMHGAAWLEFGLGLRRFR